MKVKRRTIERTIAARLRQAKEAARRAREEGRQEATEALLQHLTNLRSEAEAVRGSSAPAAGPPRPSLHAPEDDVYEAWERLRGKITEMATERGEYGGYPMIDDELRLVMEPRFPITQLDGARTKQTPDEPSAEAMAEAKTWGFESDGDRVVPINGWTTATGDHVTLYYIKRADGSRTGARAKLLPNSDEDGSIATLIKTYGAARNWSIRAEETALAKLRQHVTPYQYRQYCLTGMLLESSKRSGVMYMFRRCKPTLAIRHDATGRLKLLASLCSHPIGHYEYSYAGVMVPTDDVVAHLLLMRGDEHFYWRKCNQQRII